MSPAIVLRDAEVDRLGLRWKLEIRYPHLEPILLVVRTSRSGRVICDVQQLGAIGHERELPPGAYELIVDRIGEEVARAKLVIFLGEHRQERRAA